LKILSGTKIEKRIILGSRLFTSDNVATGGVAVE